MREIERLKQALDVKDLSLDNSTAKLNQAERELQKIIKEKDSTKTNEAKIQVKEYFVHMHFFNILILSTTNTNNKKDENINK